MNESIRIDIPNQPRGSSLSPSSHYYYSLLPQVTNSSASGQFLSVSNSANFQDSQTESNGFLILVNDAAPEVNQTYVVDIIDARFGAEVGPVDRLYLTIRDSDDPFGRIQFATVSKNVFFNLNFEGLLCAN